MPRAAGNRFHDAARIVVVVGPALAALVFNPREADAFGLPKLAVLWMTVVVAGALWLAGDRKVPALPVGWIGRLVAADLVVNLVAAVLSVSRLDSFFGSAERYSGLLSLLVYGSLAALIVMLYWRNPAGLRLFCPVMTATGAAIGAYLLIQTAGFDVVKWHDATGGPVRFQAGTLGNSDFAGAFLAMVVPFIIETARTARGRWRLACWAALAIDIAGVAASASRGGGIAVVVGLAVLAAVYRSTLRRYRRAMFVAAGGLGVLALLAGLVLLGPGRRTAFDHADVLRTQSVAARGREWSAAVKVAAQHPVLGSGPDTFEFDFPRARSRSDGRVTGLQIADKPHNVLLEHLTDTGIIGFAIYVGLLAVAFAYAVRKLRDDDETDRPLVGMFTAVLAAYLAQAVVSIDVPALAMMGWVALAGVAVLADPAVVMNRAEASQRVRGRRRAGTEVVINRPSPLTFVIDGIAVVVLSLVAFAVVNADVAAGAAQRTKNEAKSAALWQTAIRRNPLQPSYRLGAAFLWEKRGAESTDPAGRQPAFDRSLASYRKVHALEPASLLALLGQARVTTLMARGVDAGQFTAADKLWREAMRSDPEDWEVTSGYAVMLTAWANSTGGDLQIRKRAADAFEATLRIRPEHVDSWVNLARTRVALGDQAGAQAAAREALRYDPANAAARTLLAGAQG